MNIRNVLDNCKDFRFHLVGSRCLGTERPDSDWDYVVTTAPGILSLLYKLGFASIIPEVDELRVYGDNDKYVKAIMEARCPQTGVKVQVAIVADAELKLRIMRALKKHKVLRDFDLSLHGTVARNRFWTALYEIAGWQGEAGDSNYIDSWTKKMRKEGKLVDDDIDF